VELKNTIMKKHQYETVLAALRSSIALLDSETITPLERFRQTLLLTSEKINEIKKEVVQNGFSSTDEEIHFFKFVKPAFYALQIYGVDLYISRGRAARAISPFWNWQTPFRAFPHRWITFLLNSLPPNGCNMC
jgi:hypothetical protein